MPINGTNTDGTVAGTLTESTSMLTKAIDGVMQTINPDADTLGITISEARWGMGAAVVATAIGSSMYTRKRAAAMQPPIMKILF